MRQRVVALRGGRLAYTISLPPRCVGGVAPEEREARESLLQGLDDRIAGKELLDDPRELGHAGVEVGLLAVPVEGRAPAVEAEHGDHGVEVPREADLDAGPGDGGARGTGREA